MYQSCNPFWNKKNWQFFQTVNPLDMLYMRKEKRIHIKSGDHGGKLLNRLAPFLIINMERYRINKEDE
jgi:hypothetical protein